MEGICREVIGLKGKVEYKTNDNLSSAQEVLYNREFRRADKAGGYKGKRRK